MDIEETVSESSETATTYKLQSDFNLDCEKKGEAKVDAIFPSQLTGG